jgi:DNA recombination protein RmuC
MVVLKGVLGLIAAAAVGVVLWLVVGRGRLVRDEASLRAQAEGAARRAEALEREGAAEAERLRGEVAGERARAEESVRRVVALSEESARLRERLENTELMKQELEKNEHRLRETFRALGGEMLKESRQEFILQARPVFDAARKEQSDLVRPIGETLAATREKLEQLERARTESFAKLLTHIEAVTGAGEALRAETQRLTKALSRPEIRGQYGEIQLRRVAELAGMTSYCDFCEQASVRDSEGNMLRPDMVVRLPNERVIAIDAKTNIFAYIEACNAGTDAEREECLVRFARHVGEQAKKLAGKRYWSAYDGSPDFVVMFVPGDHFIDAALARQPALLEDASQQGVILASPSTLIGLLRAVAVGWREHSLTEEAKELFVLGKELHERAAVAFEHAGKLGDSIRQSVERYNRMVGSIEGRLVPTLRKCEEAGAKSAKGLVELPPVEGEPRGLDSGGGLES